LEGERTYGRHREIDAIDRGRVKTRLQNALTAAV
jgi:hypothetical protein